MRNRWTVLLRSVCVLCLATAPACSGAPDTDVRGIWNTESIGNQQIPGVVVYDGDSLDTRYVRWAFYDGGLCTLTQLVDGVTNTYDECDYRVSIEDETIIVFALRGLWDASIEGEVLTMVDPKDVTWILRRQ